ncbi:MAG TPA: glutathione S-transferase family protein [Casimicrobiaceae bacterium]|nr:glutathione S-transferase family protein [Casimicrobiaceae bacterium]
MLRVYGMSASGNCHKVRMALEALERPYAWTEIDTRGGGTRQPEFLAMNPNGKVPVLEIEPGTYLPESNAILWYLAEGTPLLPASALQRAQVLQWLFFEQYSHEPYIAVARFLRKFHPDPEAQRTLADSKMNGGYRALDVMEGQLARQPFFVGDRYSIADIGLYAYTHVADDGGFDLGRFPAVRAWLDRVRAEPRYAAMPA